MVNFSIQGDTNQIKNSGNTKCGKVFNHRLFWVIDVFFRWKAQYTYWPEAWNDYVSYTPNLEYRVAVYRYSRLLFARENCFCAQYLAFSGCHRSTVVTSQYEVRKDRSCRQWRNERPLIILVGLYDQDINKRVRNKMIYLLVWITFFITCEAIQQWFSFVTSSVRIET